MLFRQILLPGYDRNFCYLVGDEKTGECALFDPAIDWNKPVKIAQSIGLRVKYIVSTHRHFDHCGSNKQVKEATGAKIVAHESFTERVDIRVKDGEELKMGEVRMKFIHTPGHTPDGICILINNKRLITGDILFVGKVGGTHFPGSNTKQEWDSFETKLKKLPNDVEVWPGHDYGDTPSSTIGHEKKTNPFWLCKSFEEFKALGSNWEEYKIETNSKNNDFDD